MAYQDLLARAQKMIAGQRNRLVDVERNVPVRGAYNEPTELWTLVAAAVPVSLGQASGHMVRAFGKLGVQVTHEAFFTSDPQLTAEHRLRYTDTSGRTRYFRVESSINLNEQDKVWQVTCREYQA